jgi:hypothetical protein
MKNLLLGIATAVVTAGVISFFTARRIEAQYSSPVKVVNSTSAPALNSSVDDHGRIPYQSQSNQSTTDCTNASSCIFPFPPVPAGHRLVLERVTGSIFTQNPTAVEVRVCAVALCQTGGSGNDVMADFRIGSPSVINPSFNEPILGYIDAGSAPTIVVFLEGSFTGNSPHYYLAGYLLDCAAAPCAPIAH